jgi:hypothetical protein
MYFHRDDSDFTFIFPGKEFWAIETNAGLHRGERHYTNCFARAAIRGHLIRR